MAASRTTPSSSPRSSARLRLALLGLLLVPLVILGVAVASTPRSTDFLCFWSGARIILDGRDPYDTATWVAATGADTIDLWGGVRRTHCPVGYGYPLTTAVALIPLGALPIEIAIAIWQAVFVLALGTGVALLARAARLARADVVLLAIIVVGSEPLFYEFVDVRFGGLLVLATGLLATREPARAGPMVGTILAALKPHVMPLAVLARLGGLRRMSAIAAALLPFGVLVIASLLIDAAWPAKWVGELLGHRAEMATSGQSATLWMLGRVVGIPALGVLLMVLGIAALGVALWRHRRRIELIEVVAAAVVASALVVPYALSGDQLMALAITGAVVLRRPTTARTVALLLIAGVLPWVLYGTRYDVLAYGGLEVANALVPLALALLLAWAIAAGPRNAGSETARAGAQHVTM
jgi:hypothetical protein